MSQLKFYHGRYLGPEEDVAAVGAGDDILAVGPVEVDPLDGGAVPVAPVPFHAATILCSSVATPDYK